MLIGHTHSSPHPYAVVVTVAEAVTAAGEKASQVVHKHSHGTTILFTVLTMHKSEPNGFLTCDSYSYISFVH